MSSQNNAWIGFDASIQRVLRFVDGKQIILWGYGSGGKFVENMLHKHSRKITCIIDKDERVRSCLNLSSPVILEAINPETGVIICTFKHNKEIDNILNSHGFKENYNYIYLRKVFNMENSPCAVGYFSWVEYKLGLDICAAVEKNELGYNNTDFGEYGASIDYGIIELLRNFKFSVDDAIFDFGFGKGGFLVLFNYLFPNLRFGGVEFDKKLHSIAQSNLKKLGAGTEGLVNDDASVIESELDSYNYFFMYNPFKGKVFQKVIRNIQESYNRRPRKVTLLYAAPTCHHAVICDGYFRLVKQIDGYFWIRYTNIYTIDPNYNVDTGL